MLQIAAKIAHHFFVASRITKAEMPDATVLCATSGSLSNEKYMWAKVLCKSHSIPCEFFIVGFAREKGKRCEMASKDTFPALSQTGLFWYRQGILSSLRETYCDDFSRSSFDTDGGFKLAPVSQSSG